jgi:predicted nicotinamide N-methyase
MTVPPRTDATAFIAANLPLAPLASLPAIRLHRAVPASGLSRLLGPEAASPYWAYAWGGGLALAAHVSAHPETVAGKRVLDLGSGSGLVAIAAALAGAAEVTAVDIDPHAIAAITVNARANGVPVTPLLADLMEGPAPEAVDLILAGDVFYGPEIALRSAAFLARCRAAGIDVLVGDPGRKDLRLDRLTRLADYPVSDFGDVAGEATGAAVFAFVG